MTRNLAHRRFFLRIWEEAFIEIISSLILLIIAQMLEKSYFEHKCHEILHVLNLKIKVFLGQSLVHLLKGQIRRH